MFLGAVGRGPSRRVAVGNRARVCDWLVASSQRVVQRFADHRVEPDFRARSHYCSPEWSSLRTRDWPRLLFLLALLPVLLAACALAKSSTGIVMLVGGAFALWRLRLYRDRWWLASALLSALLTGFALSLVKIPGFTPLSPLAFLRGFVRDDSVPLWPVAYFGWMWLLIVVRVRAVEPAMTLRSLIARVRAGELFDLELALLIAIVASMPDAVWAIPGQSGGYFSDLHRWLALALLLGLSASHTRVVPKVRLAERGLATLGAAGIAIALAGTVLGNTVILSYGAQHRPTSRFGARVTPQGFTVGLARAFECAAPSGPFAAHAQFASSGTRSRA